MNEKKHAPFRLFRRADFLLLAGIGLLCALLFLPRYFMKGDSLATVTCNGDIVAKIDLNTVREPYAIRPDTSPSVVILVEQGAIRFESAQCPDQLCVNTGVLSQPGQTAACLPARTVIAVTGGEKQKGQAPDIMTY